MGDFFATYDADLMDQNQALPARLSREVTFDARGHVLQQP